MIEKNSHGKAFGPTFSVSGLFLALIGIIASFYSLNGIIFILLGIFLAFTSTSTIIDFEKKRIKFLNNLFGFISVGNWIDIKPDMKIDFKKSNITWRTYSMSNRTLDLKDKNFSIILYDSKKHPIVTIKKVSSLEDAKAEVERITKLLELS
ncbi:MAG TPA: hypothetical protein PLE67_13760 [Tenuifilaceae bacterium]|nr:hypothetical protein [Tenuifilaceae bacterium]